jgi:hypothetical protein
MSQSHDTNQVYSDSYLQEPLKINSLRRSKGQPHEHLLIFTSFSGKCHEVKWFKSFNYSYLQKSYNLPEKPANFFGIKFATLKKMIFFILCNF